MSKSVVRPEESNDDTEDEPDEDPKLMLLVEAGRVPGLDDNLDHLKRRNFNKKKKKKHKRRRLEDVNPRPAKKRKRDLAADTSYVISKIISYLNKPSKCEAYQNCLTSSDWLVKIPDDFEENWIPIPCPPGKRMLVVAASGTTRSFAKSGDFMFFFQSGLPGGHAVGKDESSKSLTVLDCIWHHRNKTYYVLDVLSWNNSHMLHCEAKFRFFWLEQKIFEMGSRLCESENNHYKFAYLPRIQCKKNELVQVMTNSYFTDEFKGIIDGFLFYDLNAPYLSGATSGAFWLKPFMVAEVFGVQVSTELTVDCPESYTNMEQYIKDFATNKKKVMKNERKIREVKIKKIFGNFVVNENTILKVEQEENDTGKEKDDDVKLETENTNNEKENIVMNIECNDISESKNDLLNNDQVPTISE